MGGTLVIAAVARRHANPLAARFGIRGESGRREHNLAGLDRFHLEVTFVALLNRLAVKDHSGVSRASLRFARQRSSSYTSGMS